MTNMIAFVLIPVGIGALLAIPAIALGYWLEKCHAAPNRSWLSLLFCIAMMLIKGIWFPSVPYLVVAVIAILGSTLGVYRMDIYWAIKRDKPEP
jgi:uncharacterized membrane protein